MGNVFSGFRTPRPTDAEIEAGRPVREVFRKKVDWIFMIIVVKIPVNIHRDKRNTKRPHVVFFIHDFPIIFD
jgi:hypothetical protein